MLSAVSLVAVEIYPREGTETCYHRGTAGACRVEIYPREGTETILLHNHQWIQVLKFIPVRGRKLFGAFCVNVITDVEIYPREGTETRVPSCKCSCIGVEIYPREGTETQHIEFLLCV